MEDNFDQLINVLPLSSSFTVGLDEITEILEKQNSQSVSLFVSQFEQSLSILEFWAWKLLSRDSTQWLDQPIYKRLLKTLSKFNRILIFQTENFDEKRKFSLLTPPSIDFLNVMFEQIESINDENNSLIYFINRWLNNLSLLFHEHPQVDPTPIFVHLNRQLAQNYLLTDQFRIYLGLFEQVKLASTVFTEKLLFYIKTTSFSLCSFLTVQRGSFFSTQQIIDHILNDSARILNIQTHIIELWSQPLLSCLTHLIGLISACFSWPNEKNRTIRDFFSDEHIAHAYIDSLIRIISYQPFHSFIEAQWINDQTILIDLSLFTLKHLVQQPDFIQYVRSKPSLPDTLLKIAEISIHQKICLRASIVLGEILCDARLKDLKITDNISIFVFNILERAWQHPSKIYKQIPIPHLLRGLLTLSKIDAIQQKVADLKKISLLIEMIDEYPIVLEIVWTFSFNQDIQQQLRSNVNFMSKLMTFTRDCQDESMCRSTHGILWNLDVNHDDRLTENSDDQSTFDIMISYSHKDEEICKKIYERLIENGYRVWIDFDQMHGNVMDSMAQAIERSQTIIICMSEQYRRSNYCRAEAHYAFQRGLKLVPVLLQEFYQPDGWLLFLIGQLLYVDFTKFDFEQSIQQLIKELTAESLRDMSITASRSRSNTRADLINLIEDASNRPNEIQFWNRSNVQEWLLTNGLFQMSRFLTECDGQSLIYLNEFLNRSERSDILTLLQDDCFRRTKENLSLIEISTLRSLIEKEKQKRKSRSKKFFRFFDFSCCSTRSRRSRLFSS